MILVDTNVFSETVRPVPDAAVVDWLFAHRHETLLSSLVVAEIDFADIRKGTRTIDTLLAAQALALDVPFATRNAVHFEDTDVSIINPWEP